MSATPNQRPGSLLAGAVIAVATGFVLVLPGCDGSSGGGTIGDASQSGNPTLLTVQYGRLVDVYSYRRLDPSRADRRDIINRQQHLVARDVVVGPDVQTEELFDSVGAARDDADYRFLTFDAQIGHEELLILWDDRAENGEGDRFKAALDAATGSLAEVAAAHRDQNVQIQPIPVVPRNAAFKLTFDRPLKVATGFFEANPGAIQLLRFRDDPNTTSPAAAFEVVATRVLANDRAILIDTTLLGAESRGRFSTGLVPSEDSQTANYRIAIPTDGVISRQLNVNPDKIGELNGIDAQGSRAVIRDFRSGNQRDGRVGSLTDPEPPTIIALKDMGILDVDLDERILKINKRARLVALRGRIPFVDGAVNANTALPGGVSTSPLVDGSGNNIRLPSGDFIYQDVLSPSGELVRIRAEILENLDVGTLVNDPTFPAPGLTENGTDGGELPITRVRVSRVSATDSQGNLVRFEASDLPLGEDCTAVVRYYESIPFGSRFGGFELTDGARRAEFVLLDPQPPLFDDLGNPIQDGTRYVNVAPGTAVSIRFSEPVDTANVSSSDNLVMTTEEVHIGLFQQVAEEPKSAHLTFVATRLRDRNGDGTVLELTPPLGHFHVQGDQEVYWLHVDLDSARGVRDPSGNAIDIFDRRTPGVRRIGEFDAAVPLQNFSIEMELDEDAEDNFVGWRTFRFASADEDGTSSGSVDFFGQFRLSDGVLFGAQTNRRSLTADDQNLGSIQRWDKGECIQPEQLGPPPLPPMAVPPPPGFTFGPGVLYWCPSMSTVQPGPPLVFQPPLGPQQFGGIVEPHTKRGSRLQMTYREEDFDLDYHDANDQNLDVEQLHWARWNNETVLFDRFDRYTMQLGHSQKRPDLLFTWVIPPPPSLAPPFCSLDCMSLFSGISTTYEENYLPTGTRAEVVKDAVYVINPNDAFQAPTGNNYVPYPRFERTYTWRDSRQVSYDMANEVATGLGGALAADSDPSSGGDRTASISSPWIPDDPRSAHITDNTWTPDMDPNADGRLVRDQADFLGDRTLDHDPIALPLLVDVFVWPDDSRSVANSANLFHIAYVGPCWTPINPGGYYNSGAGITTALPWPCQRIDWPFFRVHSSGGVDQTNGDIILVEPDLERVATGGVIKDMGLGNPISGLFQTKPGDSHLPWAQIDFVRKVSMMTFGFFDTRIPNQHDLDPEDFPGITGTPGTDGDAGRPDFRPLAGGELAMSSLQTLIDPPLASLPGGTRVELEFRGIDVLPNDGLYDATGGRELFNTRQNLLNPNYACEAYRYSMPNPGNVGDGPRIPAEGLTPYVLEENLDTIRDPLTGLLPRYVNFRIVMQNNVLSSPAVSPSVRSFALVYRMATAE